MHIVSPKFSITVIRIVLSDERRVEQRGADSVKYLREDRGKPPWATTLGLDERARNRLPDPARHRGRHLLQDPSLVL